MKLSTFADLLNPRKGRMQCTSLMPYILQYELSSATSYVRVSLERRQEPSKSAPAATHWSIRWARIVSGYLYNPDQKFVGSRDAGSTHAWAEVYVPGAGWITFDPTNRSFGGFNLIPVAVARDIRQAMPVVGSFVGRTDAFQGMSVEVSVTA